MFFFLFEYLWDGRLPCRYGVALTYYGISMNISGFGLNMYLTQFIYAAIEVPAKLMVYLLLRVVGRRTCQAGTLLLTGGCIAINIFLSKGWKSATLFLFLLGSSFHVNLDVSCRSLAPAFCYCHHWKRLLRGGLHHCLPLHRRALPHRHPVSSCCMSVQSNPAEWIQTHQHLKSIRCPWAHPEPPLFCLWGFLGGD